MYAHHTILPINNLHLQIDLPAEFANYTEAEIIVLPVIKKVQLFPFQFCKGGGDIFTMEFIK